MQGMKMEFGGYGMPMADKEAIKRLTNSLRAFPNLRRLPTKRLEPSVTRHWLRLAVLFNYLNSRLLAVPASFPPVSCLSSRTPAAPSKAPSNYTVSISLFCTCRRCRPKSGWIAMATHANAYRGGRIETRCSGCS
jgi:hypothetical protein